MILRTTALTRASSLGNFLMNRFGSKTISHGGPKDMWVSKWV